jgi:hypothetical protein
MRNILPRRDTKNKQFPEFDMFGKTEWFEPIKKNRLIKPTSWRGWAYFGTWAAVFFIPMRILFAIGNVPEAIVWILFAGGMFAWDYLKIEKRIREQTEYENLFFIDDETPTETVSTSNYNLKIE